MQVNQSPETLITLAANIGMWIMRGCSRIASNINSTCIDQNFLMSSRTNNPVGSRNTCMLQCPILPLTPHEMSIHFQKTTTFVESICSSCSKHYIFSTISICPIPNQKTLSSMTEVHSYKLIHGENIWSSKLKSLAHAEAFVFNGCNDCSSNIKNKHRLNPAAQSAFSAPWLLTNASTSLNKQR